MERRNFLNIGEFARVCHTTRDTLLHYDRKGLLKPDYIAGNGYRRYSMKQFFDFDLISLLKETGSTLEEIKRYRENCGADGYLGLFTERISVLEKEEERIAHRLVMLKTLASMGREALAADYDHIFFEKRPAVNILVYPVDSEKITGRESSAECYSECLMQSLMDGNAVDPPLGVIIPRECAEKRVFRICYLFTANRNNIALRNATFMEEGRYACLYHKGSLRSHEQAFMAMLDELARQKKCLDSPVYAYDQMNYVLADTGEEYIAKYVVKVD